MTKRKQATPEEASGNVTVRAERGLNPLLARQVREAVGSFACTATIRNGRGTRADARNLLELLLLGAQDGEQLSVHCVGRDAPAAYEVLVSVIEAKGGAS